MHVCNFFEFLLAAIGYVKIDIPLSDFQSSSFFGNSEVTSPRD